MASEGGVSKSASSRRASFKRQPTTQAAARISSAPIVPVTPCSSTWNNAASRALAHVRLAPADRAWRERHRASVSTKRYSDAAAVPAFSRTLNTTNCAANPVPRIRMSMWRRVLYPLPGFRPRQPAPLPSMCIAEQSRCGKTSWSGANGVLTTAIHHRKMRVSVVCTN